MKSRPIWLIGFLCAGTALAVPAQAEDQPGQPTAADATQAIDADVMRALERMGTYLSGLKSFGLRASDAVDQVLDSGQKIQFMKTVDLLVRKPDHLRADIVTDSKAR